LLALSVILEAGVVIRSAAMRGSFRYFSGTLKYKTRQMAGRKFDTSSSASGEHRACSLWLLADEPGERYQPLLQQAVSSGIAWAFR
jgi:hypothetical protein